MAFEDFSYDEKTGEISIEFMDGGAFMYDCGVDLKAFLNDLHDDLDGRGFKDYVPGENVEVKHFAPKGEPPDPGELKRTSDMYETKFIWMDKGNGAFDIEVHWKARRSSEMFGDNAFVTFTLNLVNRHMQNKEIVEGNSKRVVQTGKWEHRNKLVYTNKAITNKISKFEKIPFLSTKFLIKIYASIFYHKNIAHDIFLMEKKTNTPINELIKKHFSQ